MIAKITRFFAQNLGQAPKEAEFYSFSNAIQHFFSHHETIWMIIKLRQKRPTTPNSGIFGGSVLLIFPISELEKKQWYGVVLPSSLGFF